ncbi:MAG: TetR family transcriptional regulator [Eubacteriales bacterium]|nr:TetR family transcriptional regulator [Eubacteriales bacterium]
MDQRIYKTKLGLRNALKELLSEKPFDKIKVTEICSRSKTSRVTFYTYYNDKYDLLNDLYISMEEDAEQQFKKRQKTNNPENDFEKSLQNVLDTLVSFDDNPALSVPRLLVDRDITPLYHNFLVRFIERFEIQYPDYLSTRYPVKALNSFIAFGLWGFLHSHPGKVTREDRKQARQLLRDLVESRIFSNDGSGK